MLKRSPLTRRNKPPGYRLITHATPNIVAALDEWISRQPEPRPKRAQALGYALQDWLIGQGLLKHRDDELRRRALTQQAGGAALNGRCGA